MHGGTWVLLHRGDAGGIDTWGSGAIVTVSSGKSSSSTSRHDKFRSFSPQILAVGGLEGGRPPLLGAKTGAKWQSMGQNVSLGPFYGGKCPFGGDLRSKSRFWGDFLGQEIRPVAI